MPICLLRETNHVPIQRSWSAKIRGLSEDQLLAVQHAKKNGYLDHMAGILKRIPEQENRWRSARTRSPKIKFLIRRLRGRAVPLNRRGKSKKGTWLQYRSLMDHTSCCPGRRRSKVPPPSCGRSPADVRQPAWEKLLHGVQQGAVQQGTYQALTWLQAHLDRSRRCERQLWAHRTFLLISKPLINDFTESSSTQSATCWRPTRKNEVFGVLLSEHNVEISRHGHYVSSPL